MASPKVDFGVLLGAGAALSKRSRTYLISLISDLFTLASSECERARTEPVDAAAADDFILLLMSKLMVLLEDSEWTNAGRGSELTIEGTVECDASIMLGGLGKPEVSASIGAVPDIQHPSAFCKRLLELQLQSNGSMPRSVPNFIVGHGAKGYAMKLGLSSADLVTDRARNSLAKWKDRYDGIEPYKNVEDGKFLDTVGLILVYDGRICVASSSGGSLMKDPGRVGPAALIGNGLDINANTAAVCSGFGEDINTLRLARNAVSTDLDLNGLASSNALLQRDPAQFGILRATSLHGTTLFEWYHSTPSLVGGFGSVGEESPKFKVIDSTRPEGGGYRL